MSKGGIKRSSEAMNRSRALKRAQGLVKVEVWVPAESKEIVKQLERELNIKKCKVALTDGNNG